jgi:glycolate oxidase
MHIGLPESMAPLLIEVDGSEEVMKKDIRRVADTCKKSGATSIKFAYESTDMLTLWKGRKGVLPSLSRYGEKMVSVSLADDMSVPISNIPKAIKAFQRIAEKYGIIIGTYGHAGDGNLHTKVLIDPLEKNSWTNAEKAVDEVYKSVLLLKGTVSGEHGIGISKAPWMQEERKEMLALMEAIKKVIDPKNIMNPGKMAQWRGSIIAHVRYPVIS